MKTSEFLSTYAAVLGELLYRVIAKYQDMEDFWEDASLGNRLFLMDLTGSAANLEISMVMIYRELLVESVGHLRSQWSREVVLKHIAVVNKYQVTSYEFARESSYLLLGKVVEKFNLEETAVYSLLHAVPVKARSLLERLFSYCVKLGVSEKHQRKIFSLWIPNPYKQEEYYAPVTES